MSIYDPNDWYWQIHGGSPTQVFSSASGTFVTTSNPTYLAWGMIPTLIKSIAELYDVLLDQAPDAATRSEAVLLSGMRPDQLLIVYTNDGIIITSTGSPSINATYALDQTTLDQVGSVARDAASGLGLPGGLSTFTYPDIDGIPHDLTSDNVVALYQAMRNYVFSMNVTENTLANGGSANWPDSHVTIA